jgi:hypothetical protein
MLYDLPLAPPITIRGPDDIAWWTVLGEQPGERYALVIGNPADSPLVVAGSRAALAAYLDPREGPMVGALAGAHAEVHQTLAVNDAREPVASEAPPVNEPPSLAAELVTLPHTGIRVPIANLRVTSLRELPTPDGVAFTATLRLDRISTGTIHNEGMGGPTTYDAVAGSPLGPRDMTALVAASRSASGQPISEENLLDELVTEYENDCHVATAARAGRSPIRLMAPIGGDEHLADVYYTAHRTTAAAITTRAHRQALIVELRRQDIPAGAWWQLWTGQQWTNLTVPTRLREEQAGW